MALVTPDSLKSSYLTTILGASVNMRLFKNNVTPDPALGVGQFTEADFSGYAPTTLPSFTVAVVSHVAQGSAAPQSFTADGGIVGSPQTVYGYYVTDSGGALLWSELIATGPTAFVNPGDQLQVTPNYNLQQI
jgi:hypothetical protein